MQSSLDPCFLPPAASCIHQLLPAPGVASCSVIVRSPLLGLGSSSLLALVSSPGGMASSVVSFWSFHFCHCPTFFLSHILNLTNNEANDGFPLVLDSFLWWLQASSAWAHPAKHRATSMSTEISGLPYHKPAGTMLGNQCNSFWFSTGCEARTRSSQPRAIHLLPNSPFAGSLGSVKVGE